MDSSRCERWQPEHQSRRRRGTFAFPKRTSSDKMSVIQNVILTERERVDPCFEKGGKKL